MCAGKVEHTTMSIPSISPPELSFVRPTDERIGWFLWWIRKIMTGKLAKNMEQVFIHNIENSEKKKF